MIEELIQDKVYYKIFDRQCPNITHSYSIHAYTEPAKIKEVRQNIETIINNFNAKKILLLNQTHGNNIVDADDIYASNAAFGNFPEADASITTKADIILAIRTADCVPILLASEDGKVIGAAHCGWRSAKLDIIDKLVKTIRQKSSKNILAVIGPSIAQESYEVSEDYYQYFLSDSKIYVEFFKRSTKPNHYLFDLTAFVKLKLKNADIQVVQHIAEDTYKMAEKYPSYRRSTHTGEPYNQNILSAIVIKK